MKNAPRKKSLNSCEGVYMREGLEARAIFAPSNVDRLLAPFAPFADLEARVLWFMPFNVSFFLCYTFFFYPRFIPFLAALSTAATIASPFRVCMAFVHPCSLSRGNEEAKEEKARNPNAKDLRKGMSGLSLGREVRVRGGGEAGKKDKSFARKAKTLANGCFSSVGIL